MATKQTKLKKLLDDFDTKATLVGKKLLAVDWSNQANYTRWMCQHYHLVKYTMRLINLAAGLSECSDQKSYNYWSGALKGEMNHHKILEQDLLFFKETPSKNHPTKNTIELIETVKNRMFHSNGKALFGYALLLEGMSCKAGIPFMESIDTIYGKSASNFLRIHSDADDGEDGHFALGKRFITNNYNDSEIDEIQKTLDNSFEYYLNIIEELQLSRNDLALQKCG